MPYDPSGNFSLVPSYLAVTGQIIRTEQHNPPLEDIAEALSKVLVRDGRAGMTGPLDMGGFSINNIAAGASPSSVATVAQLLPIGAIIDYALPTPPSGWLMCYGQSLASGQYPLLRQALIDAGYPYGSSGGNPLLPDCRGRVRAGIDNMGGNAASRLTNEGFGGSATALGATGGSQTHELTTAQLPSHTHSFSGTTNSSGAHTHTVSNVWVTGAGDVILDVSNNFPVDRSGSRTTSSSGAHTHTFSGTTGSSGSGNAHPNVQPTILFYTIIKAAY